MRAYAGIGCHYMVQWMDRSTEGFTQMAVKGELDRRGAFSKRAHVFQNLGDGTYDHSGTLAIRFAVAAGVNITYKILFNDAVAMTGGQHLEGNLRRYDRAAVAAENVKRIVVVSDEPRKYRPPRNGKGLTIKDRHELDSVQRELASILGVTVLIYDQTCAAEKRRRARRRDAGPGEARLHQRTCLRRLRRLRREIQLRFGAASRNRIRPQASHRPVELQQDFSCLDGFCPPW